VNAEVVGSVALGCHVGDPSIATQYPQILTTSTMSEYVGPWAARIIWVSSRSAGPALAVRAHLGDHILWRQHLWADNILWARTRLGETSLGRTSSEGENIIWVKTSSGARTSSGG